jgi:hypothetical protein
LPQPIIFHFRKSAGRFGWLTIATALLLFVVIGVAFTVIALGALVILAPIAIIAAAISYRFPSRWLRPKHAQGGKRPVIIDGDFRIVDSDDDAPSPTVNPRAIAFTEK